MTSASEKVIMTSASDNATIMDIICDIPCLGYHRFPSFWPTFTQLGQIQYHRSPVKHDMLKTWCPCCMSNPEDYIHFLHCKKNSKQLPGIAALIKDPTNTQEHPLWCLIWRNSTLDTSGCWLACVCRHARNNHGCIIPTSGNWMGSSFARLSGQIMVWSFHDVVWRDLALLPASGIP